jgi:hypothetical protein
MSSVLRAAPGRFRLCRSTERDPACTRSVFTLQRRGVPPEWFEQAERRRAHGLRATSGTAHFSASAQASTAGSTRQRCWCCTKTWLDRNQSVSDVLTGAPVSPLGLPRPAVVSCSRNLRGLLAAHRLRAHGVGLAASFQAGRRPFRRLLKGSARVLRQRLRPQASYTPYAPSACTNPADPLAVSRMVHAKP